MKIKFNISILSTLILMACASFTLGAQNNMGKVDDLGRIAIVPYVTDQVENFPEDRQK